MSSYCTAVMCPHAGNCQFRAVADQLFRSQDEATSVSVYVIRSVYQCVCVSPDDSNFRPQHATIRERAVSQVRLYFVCVCVCVSHNPRPYHRNACATVLYRNSESMIATASLLVYSGSIQAPFRPYEGHRCSSRRRRR